MTRVSIDPITRLEGHGRIDLFLDDTGQVEDAHLVIPELRGFEKFLEGRPVEELPLITPRICGVCPEAHHAASAKAVDAVFGVRIPEAAEVIRRLRYNAFVAGDHATHFFALAGPDFIVGPDAPVSERTVFGVLKKAGEELAGQVIRMRKEAHEVSELLGGRRIHAGGMVAGGVSKRVDEATARRLGEIGQFMVEFSRIALSIFERTVLENPASRSLLEDAAYVTRTSYMGLVDTEGCPDAYDGIVRVVGPEGDEVLRYEPVDYLDHIAERVEPWSYLKFPYLKRCGWQGLGDSAAPSLARTGPLGSLNAAHRMRTPIAQAEFERFYEVLGGAPVHSTMAYHWARLVELAHCAELVALHAKDPRLTDDNVRTLPTGIVGEGVGTVEAPRGLLTHHYITDENGIVERVNMIVGTTYNYPAIQLSVRKAAQELVHDGTRLTEGLVNRIEMAFRAYDPCFGCATHALTGTGPLEVRSYSRSGELLDRVRRGESGMLERGLS